MTPSRPTPDDYPPYFGRYVDLVPPGDVLQGLARTGEGTARALSLLSETEAGAAYAPGKWSIKAVAAHVADTERVMALRLLWAARRDPAPLPGFDQDAWSACARPDGRAIADLAADLAAVRGATLTLAAGLDAPSWRGACTVDGRAMGAGAIVYVIAGHELHHRAVLARRYGLTFN